VTAGRARSGFVAFALVTGDAPGRLPDNAREVQLVWRINW